MKRDNEIERMVEELYEDTWGDPYPDEVTMNDVVDFALTAVYVVLESMEEENAEDD